MQGGLDALLLAASHGHLAVIVELVKAGADVHSVDKVRRGSSGFRDLGIWARGSGFGDHEGSGAHEGSGVGDLWVL